MAKKIELQKGILSCAVVYNGDCIDARHFIM